MLIRHLLFPVLFAVAVLPRSPAAEPPPPPSTVLVERAAKIVAALSLPDADQGIRVRDVIAQHYVALGTLHDQLEATTKELKAQGKTDKAASDLAAKTAKDATQLQLWDLHAAYLGQLAAELTPAQIDQVKDGMTFGVVPLTFRVYQQMFPQFTPAQQAQVYAWLVEAREHAVDAGSAEAKHAWFGKYKGRINNYLSAAGYNLKDAEKNLKSKP